MTKNKRILQCRWFKGLYCWQRRKEVLQRECTACLLAIQICRSSANNRPYWRYKKEPVNSRGK